MILFFNTPTIYEFVQTYYILTYTEHGIRIYLNFVNFTLVLILIEGNKVI